MPIEWNSIRRPVFLAGDATIAYRDPCGHYHDGVFRVWHTQVHGEAGGDWVTATGVVESRDLANWTQPRVITPLDRRLNYSSQCNVIRYDGRWVMCLQTYPTPDGGRIGDETARVFAMCSDDLVEWDEPELIAVKGPDVARVDLGRMFDPYLIDDKDEPGKWWWRDDQGTWHSTTAVLGKRTGAWWSP